MILLQFVRTLCHGCCVICDTVSYAQVFCSTALALISGEQNEGTQWSLRSISLTLHALRIFAREFEGVDQLVSKKGLKIIATLAQLSTDMKGEVFDQDGSGPLEERVEGMYLLRLMIGRDTGWPLSVCAYWNNSKLMVLISK